MAVSRKESKFTLLQDFSQLDLFLHLFLQPRASENLPEKKIERRRFTFSTFKGKYFFAEFFIGSSIWGIFYFKTMMTTTTTTTMWDISCLKQKEKKTKKKKVSLIKNDRISQKCLFIEWMQLLHSNGIFSASNWKIFCSASTTWNRISVCNTKGNNNSWCCWTRISIKVLFLNPKLLLFKPVITPGSRAIFSMEWAVSKHFLI